METSGLALRRLTGEQVERAIAALRDEQVSIEERIHEARKRFKEARAVMRLFRGALGGDFSVENRWYADAGREIAGYRDASAAIEAVRGLDRGTKHEIGRSAMRRLLKFVRRRRDAQYANGDELRNRIDNIVAQLPIGAARVHDTAAARDGGFELIAEGLARTFRDGQRALETAYRSGDDAAFHEWRKRAKDHWYHAQLLTPLWPEMMRGRARALRDLSQLLGHHHDLTVVRDILGAEPDTFGGVLEATRIADILRSRQKHLAAEARPIGLRIYAGTPKQFTAQMEALWVAWVAG